MNAVVTRGLQNAVAAHAVLASMAGCAGPAHDTRDRLRASIVEPVDAAPPTKPAERGAAGDADVRFMLAEVASAKGCDLIRGQFRPLHAADRPNVVTGMMWIRECRIVHTGTKVTFALSGNGWQWADQKQHEAGATFAVRQYVKFAMTATVSGALDMAYDRNDHVLSLWFSPAQPPAVTFTPVTGINVDAQGAWSSLVGAFGTLAAHSPEDVAKQGATEQGGRHLQSQLADGLSITIDLCTGLSRFALGRAPKGAFNAPDAGETKRVNIELQANGLMVFGPQWVGDAGFTANVVASGAPVHVELACREQAEALAAAYVVGGPLPVIQTLAARDVVGKAALWLERAGCQVSLIARVLSTGDAAATFDWQRPAREVARSTGGPVIACSSSNP